MTERDKLIQALEDAITDLKARLADPDTSEEEVEAINARLPELEGELALLRAQDVADAAAGAVIDPPSDEEIEEMKKLTSGLDDAIAKKKTASALIALADDALTILASG